MLKKENQKNVHFFISHCSDEQLIQNYVVHWSWKLLINVSSFRPFKKAKLKAIFHCIQNLTNSCKFMIQVKWHRDDFITKNYYILTKHELVLSLHIMLHDFLSCKFLYVFDFYITLTFVANFHFLSARN